MRRRPVLRALLATAGSSALAGCNGLFAAESASRGTAGSDGARRPEADSQTEPATDSESSAPPESTSTSTRTPSRAAGEPLPDRPRGVNVRNLVSTDRFVTVVVTAGTGDTTEEVFADSVPVPAGETVSFPGLVASTGPYTVLVETADGARRQYGWTVEAALDDLWVDLTPAVTFRRPVLCLDDCAFVAADGDRRRAYAVPSEVGVAEALGATPALAVDNDTPDQTRTTVRVWHRGRIQFESGYDLPPDVRLLVPVLPASQRYDIVLRTDDGEAIYDWQPSVRTTLYASLADGPQFRCGYADRDLRVRNETGTALRLRVRVATGEQTLLERSFDLDAGERTTVPSAVDPAGPLRFEIETADGRTERYNWVRCAPNGPITVAVSDDGVYVSVTPTRGSA